MLKKYLTTALFAGFIAGLIGAALQQILVIPVLLEAELYETGELVHFGATGQSGTDLIHDHDSHEHEDDGQFYRAVMTWLTMTANAIGLALIIVAAMAMAERAGHEITARTGLLWGAAAFLVFQMLPAIGLPTELPGNAAADLTVRKLWWAMAAFASAIGLACIAFGRNWGLWSAGIVALALPHLIGAPHPTQLSGVAPPEIAALFATRALGVGLVTFVSLGGLLGYFWASGGALASEETQ